jgi:hypothetical protein
MRIQQHKPTEFKLYLTYLDNNRDPVAPFDVFKIQAGYSYKDNDEVQSFLTGGLVIRERDIGQMIAALVKMKKAIDGGTLVSPAIVRSKLD